MGDNWCVFLWLGDEFNIKTQYKDSKYHSLGHNRDMTKLNMGGNYGNHAYHMQIHTLCRECMRGVLG